MHVYQCGSQLCRDQELCPFARIYTGHVYAYGHNFAADITGIDGYHNAILLLGVCFLQHERFIKETIRAQKTTLHLTLKWH